MKRAEPGTTLLLCALLAGAMLLWFGRENVELLLATNRVRDLFQDWASLRLWLDGESIYAPLEDSAAREFPGLVWPGLPYGIHNPHPPASLLPVLPLAPLPFQTAALVWNLISLALLICALLIVARELDVRLEPKHALLALALMLAASPLLQQIAHAQNNLLTLFLIVLAWALARRGRDGWAGASLGVAAAIKLLPALLFLVFIVERRWRLVCAGVAAFASLQCVAAALFGTGVFVQWLENLPPHAARFRMGWLNQSIQGFVARLFERSPMLPGVKPVVESALASQLIGTALSLLLVGVTAWRQRRTRGRQSDDVIFGLWTTTMLLVAPLTWDHYLLLATLPLLLTWHNLPDAPGWAFAFGAVVFLFCLHPLVVWNQLIPGGFAQGAAEPWQSATMVSYKHWGLWLLWGMQFRLARQLRTRESDRGRLQAPSFHAR
jgi:hypothetical protein